MAISYPLTFPAIAPRSIQWTGQVAAGASESPFTFAQQVQVHPGARFGAQLSFPPLQAANARALIGFLLAMRGPYGTFIWGPTAEQTALGAASGTPVVDGDDQTGSTLLTRGWTNPAGTILCSSTSVLCSSTTITCDATGETLRAGDFFSLGPATPDETTRLYRMTRDAWVEDAATGQSTLEIFPPIQVTPADGDALEIDAPVGCWRLAATNVDWSIGEAVLYGIDVAIVAKV